MKDEQLKELFKESLPQAPGNPWFVKKVMNRLPEKRSTGIEYAAYIAAILLLGAFAAYHGYAISRAAEVTMGDVMYLLSIGSVMLVVSVGFFVPMVRQWISEY